MKKKTIGKKMTFGKVTISNLNSEEMSQIHGASGFCAMLITHEPTEIPELCSDSEYTATC